ncbi:MAG TPA: S9 family peptidase [Gemmatimonas aurantiaca]|uniref:S9 family peptidase n=3 Tax=Gemmatimonas aurantiaca TaxID=173480 RepID=A0A3D4V5N3_9BACT|nr:S9 family peptidase [Gemmatimonas aurantiaca]
MHTPRGERHIASDGRDRCTSRDGIDQSGGSDRPACRRGDVGEGGGHHLNPVLPIRLARQLVAHRAPGRRHGGQIDDAIRDGCPVQSGVDGERPGRHDHTHIADRAGGGVASLRGQGGDAARRDARERPPLPLVGQAILSHDANVDRAHDVSQRKPKKVSVGYGGFVPFDVPDPRKPRIASDPFYPSAIALRYRFDMHRTLLPLVVQMVLPLARPWHASWIIVPLLAALSVRGATAWAQPRDPVPLLPLEQLMARPRVTTVQINPTGQTLAVLEKVGSHPAVVLYAVGQGATNTWAPTRLGVAFQDTVRSVSNVRWSGDGRWLLILHDRGGDEGYHLLRVDPRAVTGERQSGATATDLTPFPGAEVELLATPAGGGAIIASNHRDPRVSDVYVLDLDRGALRRLATNPGDVTVWAITPEGSVAGASAVRPDGMLEVRTPGPAPDAPWQTVYRAPPSERFTLLGAERGGRVLVARSNVGRATEAFAFMDASSGRVRRWRVSSCRGFDAGTLVTTAAGEVLGESCATSHRTFVPATARGQKQLQAALRRLEGTGTGADVLRALELESMTANGERLVFYSHAATDPGRFLLYDTQRGVADTAFAMRPDIDRAQLAPTTFHWFRARDGLRLSLLLTRSRVRVPGSANARQPAVVAVHGGPWSRDEVGYAGETQLLANRGYTVIQVNFRGSTGLGRATVDGAVGEFGQRMSDDLLDAIAWSVRNANVDPARVCILGGSYGGFAALVGMTRDAAHYRCGIDYAGPFDLETLIRAFPPSWQPFLPRSWYRFVGNPDQPAALERMRRVSPLAQLEKARGPLLVVHGDNDPRVRTDQALRVVRSWRARSLPVSLLLAGNEGHSFNEESTSLAVNRAVERFLGDWLGGRVQSTVAPDITRTLEALRAAGERAAAPAPPGAR